MCELQWEKIKTKKARDLRRRHQSFSFLKLETEVSVHLVRGSVSWVEKWQSSCFPPLRHNNSLQISDVWLTVPWTQQHICRRPSKSPRNFLISIWGDMCVWRGEMGLYDATWSRQDQTRPLLADVWNYRMMMMKMVIIRRPPDAFFWWVAIFQRWLFICMLFPF